MTETMAGPPATCTADGSVQASEPSPMHRVGVELVRLRKSTEAMRGYVLERSGHGIEGSGLGLLHLLSAGGPMRTSQLAERLGLDASTTSRHVAGLERSGHVARVPDPEDGRAWLVEATAAGRQAYADTARLRNRLLDVVLGGWPETDVAAFADVLTRFNHDMSLLDLDDLDLDEHRTDEHHTDHRDPHDHHLEDHQ